MLAHLLCYIYFLDIFDTNVYGFHLKTVKLVVKEHSHIMKFSPIFYFKILAYYSASYWYCLQHSCGKVMFSQVSVILFTGAMCIPECTGGDTPRADTPPPGRHLPPDTPSGQTPPWQTPLPPADTPWQTPTLSPTATAADGTHPTGMHSC